MIGYDHINQLLIGEFTAQTGDFSGSFDIYSRLAGSIYDEELLKKTLTSRFCQKNTLKRIFFQKNLQARKAF